MRRALSRRERERVVKMGGCDRTGMKGVDSRNRLDIVSSDWCVTVVKTQTWRTKTMTSALRIGLIAAVLGIVLLAGCELGDRVESPNLSPNTFIEEGFPDEGQTWLSDAVTFRFFGADPDNEVVAFYARLQPGLIDTLAGGVIDTLWPGDAGYHDPTPDSILSFFDWERTENLNMGYQGLADAYYRFSVKSVDEADAEDLTPAKRHFLVLAATWPEIVVDRCPAPRDASPREYFEYHGELGGLEPFEFLYSWMLTGTHDEDPLYHTWTDWRRGATDVAYSGFQPGLTYVWRVKCAIERAGVQIESRGFEECQFTIRQN